MSMETLTYQGLPNCIKLSNGSVDLIVTTAVGPRILFYGPAGRENVLGSFPDASKDTALGTWKPYGGHRLWVWPELFPATYAPDNDPVEYEASGDHSLLLHKSADGAAMEKQIRVTLSPKGSRVTLEEKITSHNLWPVDVAAWAISIVRSGTGIIPRVPFQTHDDYVAVAQPLALNAFTDLQDPRFTLGLQYILLRADAKRPDAQKIGLRNKEGWCAHLVDNTLFVKRFQHHNRAAYPDYGVNTELYVEGGFMEVELMGPRQVLWPGESLTFTEEWHLFENIKADGRDLDQLHKAIAPVIQSIL
jgi:hypothetical protein